MPTDPHRRATPDRSAPSPSGQNTDSGERQKEADDPPERDYAGLWKGDGPGWFTIATTLLALLFGGIVLYRWWNPRPRPVAPVGMAIFADPRAGGSGGDGPSNDSVIVGAVRLVRGRSGFQAPSLLVLSGELFAPAPAAGGGQASGATSGTDTRAPGAPPRVGTAGAGATTNPSSASGNGQTVPTNSGGTANAPAAAGDSLATALAGTPVADVYAVPRDTTARAALAAARTRLRAQGVRIRDLTECYDATSAGPEGCWVEVPGTRYWLAGFPSLPADSAAAERVLERLQQVVDSARKADRRIVLAVGALPGAPPRPAPPADTAKGGADTAASSAPAPRSAEARWVDAAGSEPVAAVISTAAAGERSQNELLAPPLGAAAQGTTPVRGFALVTLAAGVRRHVVEYDAAAGTFAPLPASAGQAPARHESWYREFLRWARGLADSSADLAAATVFAIAILFAFLTVAALWKVPERGGTMSTATTTATTTTAAGTATTSVQAAATVPPTGGIFEGNLQRTVWSGLTGIATVTLLTQFWRGSGVNAEALYVVVFVAAFLIFLVALAFLRGVVEALRSRVLARRSTPPWRPPSPGKSRDGLYRAYRNSLFWAHQRGRLWRWVLSLRELFLVFFDTFMNVLLGRSYASNVVWEDRIVDLQWMILHAADRVREEITTAVEEAILHPAPKRDHGGSAGGSSPQPAPANEPGGQAPRPQEPNPAADPATPEGSGGGTAPALVTGTGPPAAPATATADGGGTGATRRDGPRATQRIPSPSTLQQQVRVAISVLSDDGTSVFYISAAPGSLDAAFQQHSFAWVAAYSGQARWWTKEGYRNPKLILYPSETDPRDPPLPIAGIPDRLRVTDYYQLRQKADYEAFMLIPIPWRRGRENSRHGLIHIAFGEEAWMHALWPKLDGKLSDAVAAAAEKEEDVFPYREWSTLLTRDELPDNVLRAVLNESVNVLGELIDQFDQAIFESRLRRLRGS
jgi:hypothetical protein